MKQFPVNAIRSVELGTPDLARSEDFYTAVWGLKVVARTKAAVYLRATGRDHHVVSLREHSASEVLSVTFRVNQEARLQQLASSVTAAGGSLLRPVARNHEPDGGTAVTVRTPEGFILRFVYGDILHDTGTPCANFPLRLSHVNLNCQNIEATQIFFEQELGFSLTDRSKMMAFLSCNQDHHAVVLADAGINGMNHIAFMMPDLESVMRGSGRMIDNDFPIGWGVGRHGPGDNVFSYFVDPTGFVIEYTAEVLHVDDDYTAHGPEHWAWAPGRSDHWGIAPPKPDHVKHAQLAIRFANTAPSNQAVHEVI